MLNIQSSWKFTRSSGSGGRSADLGCMWPSVLFILDAIGLLLEEIYMVSIICIYMLGYIVVLDRWERHLTNCRKRNLMMAVEGSHLGAERQTLLQTNIF